MRLRPSVEVSRLVYRSRPLSTLRPSSDAPSRLLFSRFLASGRRTFGLRVSRLRPSRLGWVRSWGVRAGVVGRFTVEGWGFACRGLTRGGDEGVAPLLAGCCPCASATRRRACSSQSSVVEPVGEAGDVGRVVACGEGLLAFVSVGVMLDSALFSRSAFSLRLPSRFPTAGSTKKRTARITSKGI